MGAAISSITNEPKGVIRVFAETAMFKPVDWACLTIYLEGWYEENLIKIKTIFFVYKLQLYPIFT